MPDNITPEPEEGFDVEELKDLENGLNDDPIEDDDDDDEDDDLDSENGEAGECTCAECATEDINDVPRFISAIPKGSELGFSKDEAAALVRACLSHASNNDGPEQLTSLISPTELDSIVFERISELTKCIKKTGSLREYAEDLGANTTRDLGSFTALLIDELALVGKIVAKLAALSRRGNQ